MVRPGDTNRDFGRFFHSSWLHSHANSGSEGAEGGMRGRSEPKFVVGIKVAHTHSIYRLISAELLLPCAAGGEYSIIVFFASICNG